MLSNWPARIGKGHVKNTILYAFKWTDGNSNKHELHTHSIASVRADKYTVRCVRIVQASGEYTERLGNNNDNFFFFVHAVTIGVDRRQWPDQQFFLGFSVQYELKSYIINIKKIVFPQKT